ncbi:hypothetical protein WA1_13890 [Scytonema hofmannii PCC 7110]|uniref:PBS lyase n=1 Tax=Scytonema hofmannii PCC 7110 TaxID=128403 RepID=A0A139XEQ8_9CYAN|nr:HEAT repeat domain-containing protein [Scytonema hofmannii]KYC43184.1 hypothetical protein WA1_13890 [Scytonema hofmannii PCC 7110]
MNNDVTGQQETQQNWNQQLASSDEITRLRAVEALGTSRIPETESMLIAALGDESWRVRRAAVNSLAQREGAILAPLLLQNLREKHYNPSVLNGVLQVLVQTNINIVPELIDCLSSADVDLRIYAAQALGEQHDKTPIPSLIAALEDPDVNVRYYAIEALGHLRASEAVEMLLAIVELGDFFLVFPALDALTRIGDRTIAPRLLPLLENDCLCSAAVEALGQLGNESVISPLLQVLNRPNAPVTNIAQAIANLYEHYKTGSHQETYIADIAYGTITATGAENMINALQDANTDELRALVMLLSQLEGDNIERALTRLLGQTSVRSSVVEALVRYGKRATQLLIEQLQLNDIEICQAAVVALGRIGDARALPSLMNLLATEPQLIIPTTVALAQIGDARAFDGLLNLMGHPHAAVRQAAIAALNSLGHPDLPTRMVDLLQDANPLIRESAVQIAGYFAFAETEALLLERCYDDDENVRRAAIELIPYLEKDFVMPTLVAVLENETPKVRVSAARALKYVDSHLAFPYLLKTLQDTDIWVRYYGAQAMGWHGYPEAVEILEKLVHTDPALRVRIAAVEALGQIGGTKAVTILAPLVEAPDINEDLLRATLAALGKTGHPNSLPPLLLVAHGVNTPVVDLVRRIDAIHALGKRGGDGVVDMLHHLAASDPEIAVVQVAIDALAELCTPEAIASLLELTLKPTCQRACIIALASLPQEQIEAIGLGLKHLYPEVRQATVEVLTRMKHPNASELLIKGLEDVNASVRLVAVTALKHLGNRWAEKKIAALARTDPDPMVRRAAEISDQ